RNRDAAARKAVAVFVDHEARRRNHGVQVEHRLAHAHEYDVAHFPVAGADAARLSVHTQGLVSEPQLADDLGRREVAVEALLAGRAERAIERATGLARHA